jgi:Predicted transcriptional regulators
MRLFTIKELERFSGLKAHTIRTWETRFKLLTPVRRGNNIRYYTLDDVFLILHISALLEYGSKISKLAALTREEVYSKSLSIPTNEAKLTRHVWHLIACMFKNDIDVFETVLDDAIRLFGIDKTIDGVILPFLEKINLTSYRDTTINTHFVVTAIRRKIIIGIENTNITHPSKSALLFLPKDEHYDLTLLYIYYVLKRNNIKVYYLGTNISTDNLTMAVKEKSPDYIVAYIVKKNKMVLDDYIKAMDSLLNPMVFFITSADDTLSQSLSQPNVQFCKYALLLNILRTI